MQNLKDIEHGTGTTEEDVSPQASKSPLDRRMTRRAFGRGLLGVAGTIAAASILPRSASADGHDLENQDLIASPPQSPDRNARSVALEVANQKIDKIKVYIVEGGTRRERDHEESGIYLNYLRGVSEAILDLNDPELTAALNFVLDTNNTRFSRTGVLVSELQPRSDFQIKPGGEYFPFYPSVGKGTTSAFPRIASFGLKANSAVLETIPPKSTVALMSFIYSVDLIREDGKISDSMIGSGKSGNDVYEHLVGNLLNSVPLAYPIVENYFAVYERIRPQLEQLGIENSDVIARRHEQWRRAEERFAGNPSAEKLEKLRFVSGWHFGINPSAEDLSQFV